MDPLYVLTYGARDAWRHKASLDTYGIPKEYDAAMFDVLMVVLMVGFFVLAGVFVIWLEKI
jgi:hypothetical protein